MPAVLNADLYRTLKERFGEVIIANNGQRAKVIPVRRGKSVYPEVGSGGEYYRVCCPMCPVVDTGFHLYISYRYGESVPGIPGTVTNGVICFRCGNRIADSYFGDMLRTNFANLRSAPVEPIVIEEAPIRPVSMPEGTMAYLHDLPLSHPACAYLLNRGFDPVELSKQYRWMFCYESPIYHLVGRIFIPIFHEEDGQMMFVGYQSRAIPGCSASEEPKYYFMSGFKKSRFLYNLHEARKHDIVVITEGVTDAVRVGPSAVCLWGKSMSEAQIDLLIKHCSHAKVAVMLDSTEISASFSLATRLRRGGFSDHRIRGGAFPVPLPSGDPADQTRDWLLQHIRSCANKSQES